MAKQGWILLMCLHATALQALEPGAYQTSDGIDIIPLFAAEVGHNDNLFHSDQYKLSTQFVRIAPAISAEFESAKSHYQFDYVADITRYSQSSADDSHNHQAHALAKWYLSTRQELSLDYRYRYEHELRGQGLTAGSPFAVDKPLVYTAHHLFSEYRYGAQNAKGLLVFRAGFQSKNYREKQFIINGEAEQTAFYDWRQPYLSGSFFYGLSRHYSAVLTMRHEKRRYPNPNAGISSNSDNSLFYTGLDWDISGKTQGSILLGLQDKRFADSRREDFKGFSWEATLSWQPNDYNWIEVGSVYIARDPNIIGDYIRDQIWKINWRHDWNVFISTEADIRFGQQNYIGSMRDDSSNQQELSLIYHLTRYLDLSLTAGRIEQKSSMAEYRNQQTVIDFGLEISL